MLIRARYPVLWLCLPPAEEFSGLTGVRFQCAAGQIYRGARTELPRDGSPACAIPAGVENPEHGKIL